MHSVILPVWLIVLIIGLPQLSENVYTPSLPNIATSLNISASITEYTLTVYLLGFAIGTLFWGKLSDLKGRKPCVLAGLLIFIVGCIGGYLSNSIFTLMVSRFIQSFGGSIGSVLGQAICRDVFKGSALGKAYSTNNTILAFIPAIGPIIGGLIAEHFGWQYNFLFLSIFCILAIMLIGKYLPETHNIHERKNFFLMEVAIKLLQDHKVIALGIIVAASNGISFSYFAEGSFYLINLLGLSPSQYGLSFMVIALGGICGGIVSKKLHNYYNSKIIMGYGILITVITSSIFSGLILLNNYYNIFNNYLIAITIISQMFMVLGICIITSTSLALALEDYQWCIGTASSLFGFFYYCCISLVTLLMGILRNGTLIIMPIYFFVICLIMLGVEKIMLNGEGKKQSFKKYIKLFSFDQ